MRSTNETKVPSVKGVRAAKNAVCEILQGTEMMQQLLNVFAAAASDNDIPVDNQSFLACAGMMREVNRLMNAQKAGLEHILSNLKVDSAVRRSMNEMRAHRGAGTVNVA